LWACIGQELAEAQPEFGWGRGRRPRSDAELSKDAIAIDIGKRY